jgi:hypothetical protein
MSRRGPGGLIGNVPYAVPFLVSLQPGFSVTIMLVQV